MENNIEFRDSSFLRSRIYILFFIAVGSFMSLISNHLIIIYLNTSYHSFGYFFFPIYLSFFYAIAIATAKPSNIIKATHKEKSTQAYKTHTAVSIVYLEYVKKKYLRIILSILFMALVVEFAFILLKVKLSLHFFNLSLVGCSVILILRLQLVTYRVANGVFGSNHKEAKELLLFIIHNADKINLTDDDGRPKRALLPEQLLTESYQILNGSEVLL